MAPFLVTQVQLDPDPWLNFILWLHGNISCSVSMQYNLAMFILVKLCSSADEKYGDMFGSVPKIINRPSVLNAWESIKQMLAN